MARINVTEIRSGIDSFEYDVEVIENGSSTRHRVEVGKEDYEKLSGGACRPGHACRKIVRVPSRKGAQGIDSAEFRSERYFEIFRGLPEAHTGIFLTGRAY